MSEYLEETGFTVMPGEEIEVWLEGGRSVKGKLTRYDPTYKNMVIRTDDGRLFFIPRRFVVAIIKRLPDRKV